MSGVPGRLVVRPRSTLGRCVLFSHRKKVGRPLLAFSRPGIVYFIQAKSGPVKIGFTYDLRKRFRILQTHNHEELTVIAAFLADYSLEVRLLWMFRDLQIRGEWHRNDERLHREIGRLSKELRTITSPDEMAIEKCVADAVAFVRKTA